jgi:hypothetical protein
MKPEEVTKSIERIFAVDDEIKTLLAEKASLQKDVISFMKENPNTQGIFVKTAKGYRKLRIIDPASLQIEESEAPLLL